MQTLIDAYEAIRDFLELGGPVTRAVAILILILWTLILERLIYFRTGLLDRIAATLAQWEQRAERRSWHARQIRERMISEVRMAADRRLALIRTLNMLCPLLGLLGTVTGMIAVFEVMATRGTANVRSLAAGVSMATIPTMAGMVGALSGVFLVTILARHARRRVRLLGDELTMDH